MYHSRGQHTIQAWWTDQDSEKIYLPWLTNQLNYAAISIAIDRDQDLWQNFLPIWADRPETHRPRPNVHMYMWNRIINTMVFIPFLSSTFWGDFCIVLHGGQFLWHSIHEQKTGVRKDRNRFWAENKVRFILDEKWVLSNLTRGIHEMIICIEWQITNPRESEAQSQEANALLRSLSFTFRTMGGGLVPRGEKERERKKNSPEKQTASRFPVWPRKRKKNRERRKAKNEEGKIDGVDGSLAP